MLELKKIRIASDFSQQKLADILKVSRSTVAMWELNKSEPNCDLLVKISKALNVSLDELLGNSDKPITSNNSTVILRLKEVRKEHKMSQEELAKLLGVTQATLSGWENEKYEIDNKSLILCADIFSVSTDYILGRADKPTTSSIASMPMSHHSTPTENTIHITRRTGAQKSYILSDKQTDLIEGMLEQMPQTTSPTFEQIPGTIAAVTGEINKSGKKKKSTIL